MTVLHGEWHGFQHTQQSFKYNVQYYLSDLIIFLNPTLKRCYLTHMCITFSCKVECFCCTLYVYIVFHNFASWHFLIITLKNGKSFKIQKHKHIFYDQTTQLSHPPTILFNKSTYAPMFKYRIDDVMVRVLALSAVDLGFEPSGQTKN